MARLLIAHSRPTILEQFKQVLEDQGHWVLCGHNAEDVKKRALSHQPDLILLEQMMICGPVSTYLDDVRRFSDLHPFPILLLLPRIDLQMVVNTFSMTTADGFLPEEGWLPIEVLNAVQLHLHKRPSGKQRKKILRYGHLEFDAETRSIRMGDNLVHFVSKQLFELAWYLAKEAAESPEAVTRTQICKRWKNRVRDREADVAISRLKRRLPFLAPFIRTIPGRGYMLSKPILSLEAKQTPEGEMELSSHIMEFPALRKAA